MSDMRKLAEVNESTLSREFDFDHAVTQCFTDEELVFMGALLDLKLELQGAQVDTFATLRSKFRVSCEAARNRLQVKLEG